VKKTKERRTIQKHNISQVSMSSESSSATIFLHLTGRKTTVLGFVATITSVIGLFDEFVRTGSLQYLATYRLSQDHIELMFNVVRSRGRWNNNPTAGQFRSAYRPLLMKNDIKSQLTGNAVAQEDIAMLPSTAVVVARESVANTDDILKRYGLVSLDSEFNHNYSATLNTCNISEFSANIITYVAGYVSKKLCKKVVCAGCKSALLSESKLAQNCILLKRKDAGGLVYPSDNVITVCTVAECCLRFIAAASGKSLIQQQNMCLVLQIAVIEKTQHLNLFSGDENEQSCKVDMFESHQINLIRLVVDSYVNIRFYSMEKMFTEKLHAKSVRFNSNKQVLFAHQ
jgi:hypothetical protein